MARALDPEKRKTFLKTALHLFVTQGVPHTSTAQIAREAGTAAGTLFLYFPTKEDLINTLLLELVAEQSAAVNELLTPGLTTEQMFMMIWDGTIRWFRTKPEAYQYVIQVRDAGFVSEEVVQQSAMSFAFYYTAIQKGLAAGEIKEYPLDLIGDLLYHDMVAVMNVILRTEDQMQHDVISRMGFQIFWDGIKK